MEVFKNTKNVNKSEDTLFINIIFFFVDFSFQYKITSNHILTHFYRQKQTNS